MNDLHDNFEAFTEKIDKMIEKDQPFFKDNHEEIYLNIRKRMREIEPEVEMR